MRTALAVLTLLAPGLAAAFVHYTDDGPTHEVEFGPAVVTGSTPAEDPVSQAEQLYEAVVEGDWWVALSLGVVLLVWGLRAGGARLLPRLEPWLTHPLVSFALPVLSASAATVSTALAAGKPVKAALGAGLKVAMGAVFAWVGARKAREALRPAPVQADADKTPT